MQTGNLAGALAEIPDLPQPLALHYALGLVILFGEADDPRFPRAAGRWLGRFALECDTVDLAAVARAAAGLQQLHTRPRLARQELAGVTAAHGLSLGQLLAAPPPTSSTAQGHGTSR